MNPAVSNGILLYVSLLSTSIGQTIRPLQCYYITLLYNAIVFKRYYITLASRELMQNKVPLMNPQDKPRTVL